MRFLVYTLVNYRKRYYVDIFKVFLRALSAFSDVSKFDLCVISDDEALPTVRNLEEIRAFKRVTYLEVPRSKNLENALLRKFDVYQHPGFLDYDRILFLDCDIIVHGDLYDVFKKVKALPNKLYVSREGEIDEKYWTMNAYLPQDFEYMKKHNIRSFNAGTFLFIPTEKMRDHFMKAKAFGMQYQGKHFYDQSIFNYYFNRNRIASISAYLTKEIKMFPDPAMFYPRRRILHFSGIGRYKEKAGIMHTYLERLLHRRTGSECHSHAKQETRPTRKKRATRSRQDS